MNVYIMGSMRSTRVQEVAGKLRELGLDVFDDWISPGPEADDRWQAYEKQRGRSYAEALQGHHARHVFRLDKKHLDLCDVGVLVLPAGKSAHIELGYLVGSGRTTYVLFDGEPERYDIMYLFATAIFTDVDDLLRAFL